METNNNQNNQKNIKEIEITNLFKKGEKVYVIPLYQRNYAWEEKQLRQLVEDIKDRETDKYYLGTLIVSKKDDNNKYEVIDGQQRLTSLYLLFKVLNVECDNELSFACRDKSNKTLKDINNIIENNCDVNGNDFDLGIIKGINILKNICNEYNKEDLINKLKSVILYRIEVPEHTDLNKYFEIMNSRGEQLEQVDIVKAKLMSVLDQKEQKIFAKIWEACSDMTGYVQMHFNSNERKKFFGDDWNSLIEKGVLFNPQEIEKNSENNIEENNNEKCEKSSDKNKIIDIIDIINNCQNSSTDEKKDASDKNSEDDVEKHELCFQSIIDFKYFLLHTLKVCLLHTLKVCVPEVQIDFKYFLLHTLKVCVPEVQLDDKKIVDNFDTIFNEKKVNEKKQFATEFIYCLLKTRFLFDKYIIKRDYRENKVNGEWSLKALNQEYNYNNTFDKNDIKMLQAALRVSYVSSKSMHWITYLLFWLHENEKIENFADKCEDIIKVPVKEFLDDNNFKLGVHTPHIVFNYLDYLLWKKYKNEDEYKDFKFEFRNTVEHWYPQNPSCNKWKQECLDFFGNLCLLPTKINALYSNRYPNEKASSFENVIDKGPLKLRKMRDLTKGNEESWKGSWCFKHGKEMLELLIDNCFYENEIDNLIKTINNWEEIFKNPLEK